jgi:hypothetical protein
MFFIRGLNAHTAKTAATKFTPDSIASDRNPIEFVNKYAPTFNPIVKIAAAIDKKA